MTTNQNLETKNGIAIITSHIAPILSLSHYNKSCIDPQKRINDTLKTIRSLKVLGFTDIYLLDNSIKNWKEDYSEFFKDIELVTYSHPTFKNYGIAELFMLLEFVNELPDNVPLIKISGRYFTGINLIDNLENFDIVAKGNLTKKPYAISTRYYAVKNKEVLIKMITLTLNEVYSYSNRIVGFGSLIRIIKNSFHPEKDLFNYADPTWGIEHAFGRIIKMHNIKYTIVDDLGITGYVRGNEDDQIIE